MGDPYRFFPLSLPRPRDSCAAASHVALVEPPYSQRPAASPFTSPCLFSYTTRLYSKNERSADLW